jgi:competence protein ComEA
MSHAGILIVLLAATILPSTAAVAAGSSAEAPTVAAAVGAKVNINTADAKELTRLEGVSRNLAEKIVQYRDAHGPFRKATDLRKVNGVGDGVWEKNRQRIVVK